MGSQNSLKYSIQKILDSLNCIRLNSSEEPPNWFDLKVFHAFQRFHISDRSLQDFPTKWETNGVTSFIVLSLQLQTPWKETELWWGFELWCFRWIVMLLFSNNRKSLFLLQFYWWWRWMGRLKKWLKLVKMISQKAMLLHQHISNSISDCSNFQNMVSFSSPDT